MAKDEGPQPESKAPTAADAAKAVGGTITVLEQGKPRAVAFKAEHVAGVRIDGDRLVVDGIDGRRREARK